jgi:dipeptidyl aminopeptidase/acylaminoacyl peptidase
MKTVALKFLLVGGLSALALHGAWASTPASIPVRDFFRTPAVAGVSLSPSGQKIGLIINNPAGRRTLAIADTSTPTRFKGIAQFEDADVRSFRWVNDNRLVFDAVDLQAGLGAQQGSGLYAVNADGTDFVWLIERNGKSRAVGVPAKRPLPARYWLYSTLTDGSDDVLVNRYDADPNSRVANISLVRLNTRTLANRALVQFAPNGAQGWVVDRQGQPRVVMSGDEKTGMTIHWRGQGSDDWKVIHQFDTVDPAPGAFEPVSVDLQGQLYVRSRQNNPEKTWALYRFDAAAGKIESNPVVSVKGFDFDGSMKYDAPTGQLLGVNLTSDAPGMVWFNEDMKQVQAAVDKLLPSTTNLIGCVKCLGAPQFVVTASSDRQSPVYFLYNRSQNKLQLVGASRPWLDSKLMAEMDFVRIKARDGQEVPTYITKPRGKGPFPTVLWIHGGPYVRGFDWDFNDEAQFLASRGYLVIKPEFRGSTGYGDTHFRNGWRQWGLKMQDDMTDAVRWAIAQGMADPRRVAIAGGSYGGYAAMMGLVKEPELFKAGLNFVGVTDIGLMYSIGWSDFLDSTWSRYGMPKLIGDPKTDAAQLEQTSPLKQAGKIRQPVFMAYGEDDLRVPLPHGTRMRDALKASGNNQVEWVQYENEGHGFLLEKNRVDFYSRIERFLQKHLQ